MTACNGKVAIVAGGGGIGGATAHRLAASGVAVVIGDRDGAHAEAVASTIVAQGGRAFGQACDISDEADVNALVDAAVSRYGGLDMMHRSSRLSRRRCTTPSRFRISSATSTPG